MRHKTSLFCCLFLTMVTLFFPLLPQSFGTALAGEREQTVEGTLILKGNTRKNRCLLVIKNGHSSWTIVADRDALAQALTGKDGRRPRTGDYVRVTFVRKVLHIEGLAISANFFRSGERADTSPGGVPTNIGDIMAGKRELRATACLGTLSDEAHGYEDVRKACIKQHADRYMILLADGSGYYSSGKNTQHTELTWYPSEFDEGVVNIVTDGKLHSYVIYDGHYMEGAAGPNDNLPSALKLE